MNVLYKLFLSSYFFNFNHLIYFVSMEQEQGENGSWQCQSDVDTAIRIS